MGVFTDDNKLVIIVEPKTVRIDLPLNIDERLENDIKFNVSRNESLAKYAIKNEIRKLLFKYGHEHEKSLAIYYKV